MKLSVLAGFLSLSLSIPAFGGSVVVGSPGNSSNCYPFGCAFNGEYQQVYSSSQFPGAINITSLQFFNTASDGGATAMNSGNWDIYLSTTSADWDTLSAVFADNLGADNTLVYSGDLTQPWTFGNTLDIALTTPFYYNPSAGNLLMYIVATGVTDGGGDIFFDANSSNTDYLGRVYGTSIPVDGSVDSGSGLVTGFAEDSAVPEPSSLILMSGGLLALGGIARLRLRARS